ncbi:MAG: sulfatase-like hydrolase/transferase [Candidatus Thiodubiliella endoseptemdiera]|uniref:Sulfatase-like hydrolase/transferase n=1 Tax=Candidatus Thiodubiliella endoseptemdiera TaxID=2738886 RepID=A0A853F267_9GAMM|nr:sulfatase-like hydrolase/transferase [Candidatus Thiodubiliella endoseptemdiera]
MITVFYIDYLIDSSIQLLKDNYTDSFVFYASDHGESLGERGVYLHGLPYIIAPKEQTHVPMLAWFSDEKSATVDKPSSHDNISHSLLGCLKLKLRFITPLSTYLNSIFSIFRITPLITNNLYLN